MASVDLAPPVDLAIGGGPSGDLEILEQLGASERSVVYRARLGGDDYALKVRREVTTDAAGAQAFYREAAMLACLRHPGSARIETVGISAGRPYLLMELVPGRSLRDVLDDAAQPLDEARTVALAADFADALAAAHRAGLVHRDVKPENLLVTGEGRGKVIDFGLAGHAGAGDAVTAVGTALYSAPEQVGMLKRPVDGRSDLYSLGVVLFECVTGSRPFESDDLGEIIRRHAVETPPSVRAARPELSPALDGIIAHLLAKDPDDRYQSGEGLLSDLRRLMAHRGPAPADFRVGVADEPVGTLYDLPLVGRGAELETLIEAWESAKDGHGRMALVDGEPGAGKSRLVRELLRRAHHDGALVLAGKAVFEHPVPLIALRQAVDDHLGRLRRYGDAESRERVARAAAGSARMLSAFSPEVAALLGALPGELPGGGKQRLGVGTLADHQEQFYTAVASFIADLARESGRMVLAVDDVQWLDAGTRQVFQMLSPILSDIPLLVVGAARCDPASLDGHDQFVADAGATLRSRVRVEPLDQRAEERLVAEMLRADPAEPDFVHRLRARSNGNPLATVEYLRAVIDAGLLRPSWGTYMVDTEALDRMRLPNDVMELVLHRADDLGSDARRMLVAAAAVGTRFRPDQLRAVVGADEETLRNAVADALAARLIERLSGDEFAFVHDRIREAMLEPLTPDESRRLHQQIAEALDAQSSQAGKPGTPLDADAGLDSTAALDSTAGLNPDGGLDSDLVFAVARHYALGEADRTPVKVFEWNSAAARRAMAGFAAPTAARCFGIAERAARQAGIETDAEFEESFGLALLRTRDAMGATHHLRRALERHPGTLEQGRIHTNLARVESAQWHHDEAWSHVLLGLRAIGHPLPANPVRFWLGTLARTVAGAVRTIRGAGYGSATPRERAEIRTLLGLYSIGAIVSYIGIRPGRMSALILSSLGPAHRLGDSEEMVRAYTDLSTLAGILRLRRLRGRLMARSEDVAQRVGDPWSLARAHVWFALSYELSGETVAASRLGARTLREEGRWLDTEDLVKGAEGFPNILDQRGHLREAHDLWFEAQDVLARDTSAGGDVTVHAWFTPLAHAGAGRRADALRTMARCEEAVEGQAVGRFARAGFLMFRMRCMVELDQLDDYPELVARFDALRLRAPSASVWLKGNWAVIADAALELARRAGPEERPAAMAEARRRVGALRWVAVEPVFRAHFAAARARLAQLEGRQGRAARFCRRAEHLAVIADAPIVHFQVALVRARLADAQGHPEESRRQVLGALQLAAQHGWVNQPRRVRAEFGQTVRAITQRADRTGSGPNRTRSDRTRSDRSGDTPWQPESPRSAQLLHDRRNLDALLAVHTCAAQQREPEAIAKVALDQAIGLLGAERGIWFTEARDGSLVVGAARDTGGNDLAVKDDYASTVVGQVRDELRPIVVTGTREGAAIGSESAVLHDLRSIMAAPLVQEGAFMGVVYLDSRLAKGVFTDDDLTMLSAISSHIAVSMTTLRAARLESAVAAEQQERHLAQAIQDFTSEVNASLDPAEVAERAGVAARRLLPFDQWVMLDRGDRRWSVQTLGGTGTRPDASPGTGVGTGAGVGASAGSARDHAADRPRTLDVDTDPFLAALDATSRPLLVARATEADVPPPPGVLGEAGSWMSVPTVEGGRLLGVSLFAARAPGRFGELQLQLAATLAAQAQSAVARARLHQEVQRLAGTDELTSVNSRRRFFDLGRQVVTQAHRYRRPTSVAMLDIDLFKDVNDRYGHDAGDDVIRTIARRLLTSVRESDVLGRYGGDEFALVLPETDVTAARAVAERLRAAVEGTPVPTPAGEVSVTISVGLTMLRPDGQDLGEALRDADAALYRAKAAGRNGVAVL